MECQTGVAVVGVGLDYSIHSETMLVLVSVHSHRVRCLVNGVKRYLICLVMDATWMMLISREP